MFIHQHSKLLSTIEVFLQLLAGFPSSGIAAAEKLPLWDPSQNFPFLRLFSLAFLPSLLLLFFQTRLFLLLSKSRVLRESTDRASGIVRCCTAKALADTFHEDREFAPC